MTKLLTHAVFTAMIALGASAAQSQELKPAAQILFTNHLRTDMKTTNEQKAGILHAIELYMDAGRKGDSKGAKEAFASIATVSWAENGEFKTAPIQLLYDFFDQGALETSYELTSMDVAEDVAIVRIESQFGAAKFADMFTLVKDGDKWKIVSKVYHAQ